MSVENKKICIIMMHDIPTIWNEDGLNFIKKHRIMGTPIGPSPKFLHEKTKFNLPIRLMNVEAKLLIEKGLANIGELPPLDDSKIPELKEKYSVYEETLNKMQNKVVFEEKKAKIQTMAEKILEGKRKKLKISEEETAGTSLSTEVIIDEELKKISLDTNYVAINMEHPFLSDISLKKIDWGFPRTDEERLQYYVFRDMWEKEFHLTCGIKFGGDYLAYYGDPQLHHAAYIIKCISDEKEINTCDLAAWIRVGTITKKTLVIASIDEKDVVHYQSFHWDT